MITARNPAGSGEAGPLMLSAADVGPLLGISLSTVRRWDAAGLLPRPAKIGNVVRWHAAEFREWADAGCPDRLAWEAMRRGKGGRR